jgi:hypothetical protein
MGGIMVRLLPSSVIDCGLEARLGTVWAASLIFDH